MFDTNMNNYYGYNDNTDYNNPVNHQMMREGTIVEFNDNLYQLIRMIKKTRFTDIEGVKIYSEYLHADSIKQNQTHYLFLRDIPDIEYEEIIEEVEENTEIKKEIE